MLVSCNQQNDHPQSVDIKKELAQSLSNVNENAEKILIERLKNVNSLKEKQFSASSEKKATVGCILKLFSLFGTNSQKVLEIYSSIRKDFLKPLFDKWLSETVRKKSAFFPSHQILLNIIDEEFDIALNSTQNFAPYEFLHSTCLNPLVQSASEWIRHRQDKEKDKENNLLDLVYGFHSLEYHLDSLFKKTSIGDDKMFNTGNSIVSSDILTILFCLQQKSRKVLKIILPN